MPVPVNEAPFPRPLHEEHENTIDISLMKCSVFDPLDPEVSLKNPHLKIRLCEECSRIVIEKRAERGGQVMDFVKVLDKRDPGKSAFTRRPRKDGCAIHVVIGTRTYYLRLNSAELAQCLYHALLHFVE